MKKSKGKRDLDSCPSPTGSSPIDSTTKAWTGQEEKLSYEQCPCLTRVLYHCKALVFFGHQLLILTVSCQSSYSCHHQATRLLMVLGGRWPRINFWCLFILLPWTSSGLDELRTARLSKIFQVQLWDRHLSQWNMRSCIQVVALYCLFSTCMLACASIALKFSYLTLLTVLCEKPQRLFGLLEQDVHDEM
jgi:hypothetical protein